MSAGRTAFAILLVLGCLVSISTASVLGPRLDSLIPRSLEQRDINMTLTDDLLSVVAAANDSSTFTRDVSPSPTYTNAITANAAALNKLFGQFTVPGITHTTRASLTCGAASLIFGNDVITSKSPNYSTEQNEPWSSLCHLPASCFIKPQNSLEVALALKIITTFQAIFATRGAGHNPNPGFSSMGQDGIVLDLGSINRLTFNEDKSTVSFGPGSQWDQVYEAVGQHNLSVAGGRAAGVGVTGLLLGGGMSHFSNFWGMLCDNVLNYEVVLADSRIVQANANQNADLFRALKGGGPNFGIVTGITVKTFPGSDLWYQVVVYNVKDVNAVMNATGQIEEAMLQDNRIGFFLSDAPGSLTAGMVYRGGPPPASAFQAFDGITPLLVAIPPTNGDFHSGALALASPHGLSISINSVSVAADASLYIELHDILAFYATNSAISVGCTIQPFSAQGVAYGVANGGNSVNVASQTQAWLAYAITWTDESLNVEAIVTTLDVVAASKKAAAAKGKLLDLQFMNDSGYRQSPLASYGSARLSYLKSMSKKYDPTQVFQRLQNSGFLVSKA